MADLEKTKRIFQKPNGFEKSKGLNQKPKKPDNDKEEDKEDDIDNDLLSKEEKEEKLQQRFIECLNSFNEIAVSECLEYLNKLPYSVINSVLTRTAGIQNPNWNYAKTILDDYVKRKIDTLKKIEIEQQKFTKNKKGIKNYEQRQYDNLDFLYKNLEAENGR